MNQQINTVLSSSLCSGIVAWVQQNEWFKSLIYSGQVLFKNSVDYYRIDFPQGDLTALSVYPINNDTVTEPGYENGQINIDIVFDLGAQRENRAKQIYGTAEMVRAQFLNNPVYLQQFLSSEYAPGLLMINGQNKFDYAKLNSQILSGAAVTTLSIVLNYKISILLNQRALWAKGVDFYSPCQQLYYPINEITIDIVTGTTQPEILGFAVTTTNGYNANGVLIIPSGKNKQNGLILGCNGNIYTQWLLAPIPSPIIVEYYNVPVVNSVYPEPGLLCVGSNIGIGNAALLIGDFGNIYNVVYDGTVFNSSDKSITLVNKNNNFPISGTLLSKKNPVSKNGAVLFGDNGQIYNIKLI
jgi:hypothetical protein